MTNKKPTGKFYYTSGPKTGNPYFSFQQFTIHQDRCAMKVCTDACLLGAWTAQKINDENKSAETILDVGTGTGLLALMLAQKTHGDIDAIELNTDAAAQAKENVESSPWADKIQVHQGDVMNFETQKKYDLVISNPPFFENDLQSAVAAKNEAMHGTTLTLEELSKVITSNLKDEGLASIMLPANREDFFKSLADSAGLYTQEILKVRQTPNHSFFRSMFLLSKDKQEVIENELSIKDESSNYTPEFMDLLQDYYLKV